MDLDKPYPSTGTGAGGISGLMPSVRLSSRDNGTFLDIISPDFQAIRRQRNAPSKCYGSMGSCGPLISTVQWASVLDSCFYT